jgi:hypothetical protein
MAGLGRGAHGSDAESTAAVGGAKGHDKGEYQQAFQLAQDSERRGELCFIPWKKRPCTEIGTRHGMRNTVAIPGILK